MLHDLLLLLLLGWCNFLPILGRWALKDRFAWPVDLGLKWFDKRPVFGPHKTWRGLTLAVAGTTAASAITPFGPILGAKLAGLSMIGDLIASFIKRRLGLRSGQMALGLDQGMESFLPLFLLRDEIAVEYYEILILVILFAAGELIISPILYKVRIRRNPH